MLLRKDLTFDITISTSLKYANQKLNRKRVFTTIQVNFLNKRFWFGTCKG